MQPDTQKTRRLNMEADEETIALIKQVQARMKAASMAETIRRSMALVDYLTNEIERGRRVILFNPSQETEEVLKLW